LLNGLSLFSGIGGIDVALSDYVRPIAYCEIDPYCQGVLLSRMVSGDLAEAPIWDDIKTLRLQSFDNSIDILYGGFPCQGISIAGLGKGLEDERSGLFFEIVRLISEIRPRFLFLENVPAITTRGGLEVVKEITKMGYDSRWITITASSVGALHKRERWFLLAHPMRERLEGQRGRTFGAEKTESTFTSCCKNDGNTDSKPGEQTDKGTESEQAERGTRRRFAGQYWPFESREHWQETVSSMGKCSDGIPFHVDRIRGLGNAVVPIQAK
jgi:DNA (cytosine-5)-methyltransferase 1